MLSAFLRDNYSEFWRLQNEQLEPAFGIFQKGGLPFVQITLVWLGFLAYWLCLICLNCSLLLPWVASVSNHVPNSSLFAKFFPFYDKLHCSSYNGYFTMNSNFHVMSCHSEGWLYIFLFQLHLAGFASPTPIQAQTWPIALQNRDIVAIAKTGSGKTLGYLIPAFILLRHHRNNAQNGPTVLVLAPTRELATQIQNEVIKFGRSSRISCTVSS